MTERRRAFTSACLATLMSGGACMFYQLAWVRELTTVTTAATVALVIVLAAFMTGLGLGAWFGARLVTRVARPLRTYAIVEALAAVLFLAGIFVLPASVSLQGALIDAGASARVALVIQLVVVGGYLVLATTLLGTTLPLLIAGLEHRASTESLVRSDAAYGVIYGINTLGAVAGCLLCGYVTIELVGLDRSIALGAACSAASAIGAIGADVGGAPVVASTEADVAVSRRLYLVVFAVGALAIAAEVLWVRMLSLVVFTTVYAYTQVLAAVLLGIAIAGIVAARIARRLLRGPGASERLATVSWGALLVAAVWTSLVPWLVERIGGTSDFVGLAASGQSLKVIAMLVVTLVPGSTLLALVLPLLIAASGARDTARVVGRMFAINTLGCVAGALITGLWILPALGLGGALLALSLAIIGAAAVLRARSIRSLIALGVTGALSLALHLSRDLPEELYAMRFENDEHILEFREGITSDVLISEDPRHHRRIWINSSWVAGTGGGHDLLGYIPALSVGKIDRAMGIALGTGQTFGAVVEQGAAHLDCVEINPDVVALSRKWFADFNHGLFDRAETEVHIEDGRAFLRATRDRYDLIVLEPLQAWSAGTSALYSREFYTDAKRVLRDGGVLAQWIPFYGQDTDATRAMVRTAIDVFPDATLWLDENDGILLLYQGKVSIPWPALQTTLRAQHGPLLAKKHLDADGDLLSLFLMGPRGLQAWTRDAEILEDDRPFLEYVAARQLGSTPIGDIVRSAQPYLEDPAAYVAVDSRDILVARRATLIVATCEQPAACATELERDLSTSRSERLRNRYRQLVLGWADTSSPRDQPAIFLRGIEHDPEFGEAMINLAILDAQQGNRDEAIRLATRAAAIERTRGAAERVLARLQRNERSRSRN